jgi:hypothetical protein
LIEKKAFRAKSCTIEQCGEAGRRFALKRQLDIPQFFPQDRSAEKENRKAPKVTGALKNGVKSY